ncbi:caspase family protein [Streptomyces sp. NPDC048521]|uniref:caspase family protein n=1 Tax=Streptomyces sp. NPDC048521 TaxID=3365566 RepID=UPI003721323D
MAAGTRRYREGAELPRVHEDVDRVVGLFTSMGYERVLTSVSYDPSAAGFENALADWCHSDRLTADDVVVVYYAGHGDLAPSGGYRLACADSAAARPRSWLSLTNIAMSLADSPVRNVLLIVDACLAAAAGSDIGQVTDAIVARRPRADTFGAGTWLLASARHRDLAVDGAFVTELASACGQGDGPSQRYLAPSVLADRVNRSFVAAGLAQRAACSSVDQSEPPPFFLNPAFDEHAEIYFQRLPPTRHAVTIALLTALAFGEGNGLPRRIWVPVAARLQAGVVTLHDLDGSGQAEVIRTDLDRPALVDHIHRAQGTVVAIAEWDRLTLLDLGSAITVSEPYSLDLWRRGRFAHASEQEPVFVAANGDELLVMRLNGPTLRARAEDAAIDGALLTAPVLHDERVYLVISDLVGPVLVVDCASTAVSSPLYGHESAVCLVRVLSSADAHGPDVLAIGTDGTARLWPWPGNAKETARAPTLDAGSPRIDDLVAWHGAPGTVLAFADGGMRSLTSMVSAGGPHQTHRPPSGDGFHALHGPCVPDPDGLLNMLVRVSSGVAAHAYAWCRVGATCVDLQCVTEDSGSPGSGLHAHLVPPTSFRSRTRGLFFDALQGTSKALDSPDTAAEWEPIPWGVAPRHDVVVSTAFTGLSGRLTLITAVRPARSLEQTVGGSLAFPTMPGLPGAPAVRNVGTDAHVVGRVWTHGADGWADSGSLPLVPGVVRLLPHHGAGGTRWIAQRGQDNACRVLDLETVREYALSPPWSPWHRPHAFTSPRGEWWTEQPDGTPLLLFTGVPSDRGGPASRVLVWGPDRPEQVPRALPVLLSGALCTGQAPNGEAVVAFSDASGVSLCHLPSCEKVWSAPLPAHITALVPVPGSPHLDLAVGTQQGVVFLRPRLSRSWRDRLGVG